jgi:microcystin degradation protein MlrC
MKILIAELSHETNTFSSERCDFARFAPNGWKLGQELLDTYSQEVLYLGGMIFAARELGVELIPAIGINNAGPLITRECLDYVLGTLIGYVKKHRDELDGLCLSLHGAGCAETTDDLEAYTLEKVREVVGPAMPITVCLDLHGNISPRMAELADGLYGIKEYPHTDCALAGRLAMRRLVDIIQTGKKPYTALKRLPLFTTPSVANTFQGPLKSIKEMVARTVEDRGLLDAAFFHGFPYQDTPWSNASVVAVADTREKAEAAAAEIARRIWEERASLQAVCLSPDEAIDQAEEALAREGPGYVVINEASDNPGGGCPCDGTHTLRALLNRKTEGAILGIIYDPAAARQAHEAGVGGRISGPLGGKTDRIHGDPIEMRDAEVLNLSNGDFTLVSPVAAGARGSYGKTARIRVGTVEVVVTEILACQTYDDRPFVITGADLGQYRIAVVKSTNHFRGYFASRAKAIVTADPPGIHTANFAQLNYRKIQRPLYPLDKDAVFIP